MERPESDSLVGIRGLRSKIIIEALWDLRLGPLAVRQIMQTKSNLLLQGTAWGPSPQLERRTYWLTVDLLYRAG